MGSGSYAVQLDGTCLQNPTRIGMPFKEFCIHTLVNTNWPLSAPTYVLSGTTGCATYYNNSGTGYLPPPKIPDAIEKGVPVYGNTTSTPTIPGLFNVGDLANWRSRYIDSRQATSGVVTGPAVQQGHMVTEVRRRLKRTTAINNTDYYNRLGFYFTDSNTSLCGNNDWLGTLNPSSYFWTNKGLIEPFMAGAFFEDSGQSPVIANYYNSHTIPFCTPITAYSAGGTAIGQYVGYTIIYVFSFGYINPPTTGCKPLDYYSLSPTPPEIDTTRQLLSLDCHLYMAASPVSSGSLKSPRLNTFRFWHYNREGNPYDVFDKYFYFLTQAVASDYWIFNVNFNHYGGGSETIQFNLSFLKSYVTP